jgi:hypothetical protein
MEFGWGRGRATGGRNTTERTTGVRALKSGRCPPASFSSHSDFSGEAGSVRPSAELSPKSADRDRCHTLQNPTRARDRGDRRPRVTGSLLETVRAPGSPASETEKEDAKERASRRRGIPLGPTTKGKKKKKKKMRARHALLLLLALAAVAVGPVTAQVRWVVGWLRA